MQDLRYYGITAHTYTHVLLKHEKLNCSVISWNTHVPTMSQHINIIAPEVLQTAVTVLSPYNNE